MKTLHSRRHSSLFLILAAMLLAIGSSSCELSSSQPSCYLEVTVTGAFSSKPRENLTVTVYKTEADAQDQKNDFGSARTNADGIAEIRGLETGISYWVRAQATLSKTIRETSSLSSGRNTFKMSIL